MQTWCIVLIVLAALLLLGSIALAAGMFCFACLRKKRKREDTDYGRYQDRVNAACDWFESQPYEDVSVESFDGLRLYGRLLEAEKPRGAILMMHGFHGDALNDFAPVLEFCHANRWTLLIPDERTHGRSEGRYITYGVKERRDCRSWTEYLNKRFGAAQPIFLHGLSMGCATVLMATELPLPENVHGVVADCGYTQPWDIMEHVLKNMMHLPVFPTLHLAGVMARVLAGFGLHEVSVERAMRTNRLPVLFFHGVKDGFVPLWMGNANYAACRAEKKQVLVQDADHAQSFLVEPERCLDELETFLEEHLP